MNEKTYNSYNPERLFNFKTEADEIMKNLKESPSFCYHFFYDTKLEGCNIARLRSKIIKDIKDCYDIIVSDKIVSDTLYLTLWAGGTWKPLDTYNKQCTFFAWLRKVAKNAIMERLENEHWVTGSRTRTAGNTRLALRSQSKEKCQLLIDELMKGSKYYEMLMLLYVERLPMEKIIQRLNLKEEEFEQVKKAAEHKLKDALLRSDLFFESDVLRDKTSHIVTVSSECVADIAEWCKSKIDTNPLADVLGTDLSDEETRMKVIEFLYGFSAKLNWSEQVRYIWRKRFLENAAPVELAKEFGRSRIWLDIRYSRLNKKFNKEIRKWWHNHAL